MYVKEGCTVECSKVKEEGKKEQNTREDDAYYISEYFQGEKTYRINKSM